MEKEKDTELRDLFNQMTFGPIPNHKNDIELLRMFAIKLYRAFDREKASYSSLIGRIYAEDICAKCERRGSCIDAPHNVCVDSLQKCPSFAKVLDHCKEHAFVPADALFDFERKLNDESEQGKGTTYGNNYYMTGIEWAENEIKLLKKNEPKEEGMFDYVGEAANSALRAFRSLEEDGHSGLSISVTASILRRLIKHLPLTPLTGEDDEWQKDGSTFKDGTVSYQNKRYSALFKNVHSDGSVTYSDNNQFVCVNTRNYMDWYHLGLVDEIVNKEYPSIFEIKFPYFPKTEPAQITVEDIISDEKNGDIDTIRIRDVYTKSDDTKLYNCLPINKIFAIEGDEPREIDFEEWSQRYVRYTDIMDRREKEAEERKKKAEHGGFTPRENCSEISPAKFDKRDGEDKEVKPDE